jgi:hypothetical protein
LQHKQKKERQPKGSHQVLSLLKLLVRRLFLRSPLPLQMKPMQVLLLLQLCVAGTSWVLEGWI